MIRKMLFVVLGLFLFVPIYTTYAASNPIANFDGLQPDGTTLYGWAYDPDETSVSPTIQWYIDGPKGTGVLANTTVTNASRPDVNSYFNITGTHGFQLSIPTQYRDGKTHSVYPYVLDTTTPSTAVLAWNSPKTFTLGSVAPNVPPVANFDGVKSDGTTLYGWAYDPDQSSVSVSMQLYADGPKGTGTLAATSTANASRPDVSSYFGISGNHGFEISIPALYRDSLKHNYYIYAVDSSDPTSMVLGWNSPKSATVAGPVYQQPATTTATSTPPAPPTTTTNKAPVGTLDRVDASNNTLVGWANDPDQPSVSISVAVYIDGTKDTGTLVATAATSVSRPDVNSYFNISGNHGFVIPIPAKYLDGGGHSVFVYGIDSSNSSILGITNGSPSAFTLAPPATNTTNSGTNTKLPTGNVDFVRAADGMLSGWSYDPDQPTQANGIRVYVDGPAGTGALMVSDTTSTYRSDVNAAFSIVGYHGFETFIPAAYRDGKTHTAYVYAVDALDPTSIALISTKNFTIAVPKPMSGPQICGIGVNLDGAEGGVFPNANGYTAGTYQYPTTSELDYYHSKGLNTIRIPLAWEELQPTLNGPLSATTVATVENIANDAAARGMRVIVDIHNFGRYNGGLWSTTQYIGSANVPISSFKDLWIKLAAQLKGKPGVWAYDIMNEPHDMGSPSTWPAAAQAAVDGIRAVDSSTLIMVEGEYFAAARYWPDYNNNLIINDPAGNFVYSAHLYLDQFGAGTYYNNYDGEHAYDNVGVDRLQPFTNWLLQQGAHGYIGEFSAPGDDARWMTALGNLVTAMKQANTGGAYFTGGIPSLWQSFTLEPTATSGDRPQIPYLQQYTGTNCN